MGRRGGGGMRSGPSRRSTRAASPPPRSTATSQQGRPSMMGGLAGTMMQGMAFGAGSEVAHTAVRGLMGGGSHQEYQDAQHQQGPQQQADPCFTQNQDFMNCLQMNKNDIGACQSYLDLFKMCRGQY